MKRLLLLAALTLTAGCFKINYVTGAQNTGLPTHEEWHHIAILALVELSEPVPLNEICPNGFSKVHHEVSFTNGLVTQLVGGGLYNPSTIQVYCSSGSAFNVEVNNDGLAESLQRFE